MTLDLSADDLLTTTRAVRWRLDLDRPVERRLIEACVRIAQQAPNGSNRQEWHFVAVGDPAKKVALADLYRLTMRELAAAGLGALRPATDEHDAAHRARVQASADHLAATLERVPWLVVACQTGRPESGTVREQASWWGSLLPAVWSFMLAARERGLGTAWTTVHLGHEREAAEVLGIPYDTVMQGALIPVAYSTGTDFSPAARKDVERVLHWDTW